MELVLLAIAATGMVVSIYVKYAFENARRRSSGDADVSPSATPSTLSVAPRYVVIERARSTSRSQRRRHRPMRLRD